MAIKFFAFFFSRQSVLSDDFGLNGRHHWQLRAAAQRCGAGGCRREATWISGKNRLKNPIEAYFLLFSQIDAQTLQNCANKKCPRSSFCTTAPQKSRAPNRLGSLRSPQSKASPGCTKPRQHVFLRVIHSWHLAVAKYEELKNTQTNRFLEHPLHNIYRKIWISKYFINYILMFYTIHGKFGNGLLLPPGCHWDFSCWVTTGHVGGVARPCEM